MANYSELIQTINDSIKANGKQQITGPVLNSVLNAMVSSLGNGWQFGGVVTPASNPGPPDAKLFYLAWTPGTYTGFGNKVLEENKMGVFTTTGSTVTIDTVNLGDGPGTYVITDLELLDQSSATSEQIDEAIGGFDNLVAAIQSGAVVLSANTTDYQHSYKVAVAELGDTGEGLASITILNTSKQEFSRYNIQKDSSGSLSMQLNTTSVKPIDNVYTVRMKGLKNTSNSNEIIAAIGSWPGLFAALSDNRVIMEVPTESEPYGSLYVCHIVTGTVSSGTIQLTALDSSTGSIILKTYTVSAASSAQLSVTVESISYLTSTELGSATLSGFKTASKTIPGAVNELFDAAGQPTIEDIDLATDIEAGYYWNVSGVKAANASYSIKYVNLNKGDLLIANVMSSGIIAQLTVVNDTHVKAVQLIDSKGVSSTYVKYSFLADKDCVVAISRYGTTATGEAYAYIVKSSQNAAIAGIATSTVALHKIYESYGAVYNKDTGYWELNGLTDLTEEEMYDIYLWTHNIINQPNLDNAFSYAPIRTTFSFPFKTLYRAAAGTSFNQAFLGCNQLEVICLNSINDSQISIDKTSTACRKAFNNCARLREIKNVIYVGNNAQNIFSEAFNLCAQLNKVKIKGLRYNVSFKHSPLLSYESLNYIVTNAANTSAITITVHPTTYSYLTGTAQPTAEVGGTTDEWQALVTAAQAKQISFAVPEDTQSEENV